MHLYGLHVGSGGVILPEHDVRDRRRGAPARRHHERHRRRADRPAAASPRWPARCSASSTTRSWSAASPSRRRPCATRSARSSANAFPNRSRRRSTTCSSRSRGRIRRRADRRCARSSRPSRTRSSASCAPSSWPPGCRTASTTRIGNRDGYVAFVSRAAPNYPRLEIAPLDVGAGAAQRHLGAAHRHPHQRHHPRLAHPPRRAAEPASVDELDVGSPFDYAAARPALLRDPAARPRSPAARGRRRTTRSPRSITAAGGRTLALFTSWKAMDAAAAAVRDRWAYPILTQRDLPKTALVQARSASDEYVVPVRHRRASSRVSTSPAAPSAWSSSTASRSRGPTTRCCRRAASCWAPAAFSEIDLPRAAMLLAQATGRLIRTATDRGVVAVLDPRLGKASYRWDIVTALPPMRAPATAPTPRRSSARSPGRRRRAAWGMHRSSRACRRRCRRRSRSTRRDNRNALVRRRSSPTCTQALDRAEQPDVRVVVLTHTAAGVLRRRRPEGTRAAARRAAAATRWPTPWSGWSRARRRPSPPSTARCAPAASA